MTTFRTLAAAAVIAPTVGSAEQAPIRVLPQSAAVHIARTLEIATAMGDVRET